jgi:hypothetical protein
MAKPRGKSLTSSPPTEEVRAAPQPKGWYYNRWLVYSVLVFLGVPMLLDSVPQYTLLHGQLRQGVDPLLDVTGLWQGGWELFAPSPDHVNVKVGAIVRWQGEPDTLWEQPSWHDMSPWERIRHFRQMSYYDNLVHSSNAAAWPPFCEHLQRELSAGRKRELLSITLYQQRDVLDPPDKTWRPAYAAPAESRKRKLTQWTPPHVE